MFLFFPHSFVARELLAFSPRYANAFVPRNIKFPLNVKYLLNVRNDIPHRTVESFPKVLYFKRNTIYYLTRRHEIDKQRLCKTSKRKYRVLSHYISEYIYFSLSWDIWLLSSVRLHLSRCIRAFRFVLFKATLWHLRCRASTICKCFGKFSRIKRRSV